LSITAEFVNKFSCNTAFWNSSNHNLEKVSGCFYSGTTSFRKLSFEHNKELTRQFENTSVLLLIEAFLSREDTNHRRRSLSFNGSRFVPEEGEHNDGRTTLYREQRPSSLYPDRVENRIHVVDITADSITIGMASITCR